MAGDCDHNDLSSFNLDSIHLRQIFPVEVWKLIVTQEKLLKNNPEILENLAISSSFFRNMLIAPRTSYLFQHVLGIVAPKLWTKSGLIGLPIKDVLQCRGVSICWNNAVDKLIPEKFQFFGKDSGDEQIRRIGARFKEIVKTDWWDRYKTEEFIQHFGSTHQPNQKRNPFIWSPKLEYHIGIDEQQYSYENERSQSTFSLVSKYGYHIYHIIIYIQDFDIPQSMSKLSQLLSLLPNLQIFELSSARDDLEGQNDSEIYSGTFPNLKELRTLHISSEIPGIIVHNLLQQYNQVSTLIFDSWDKSYDLVKFLLPNLKVLEIGYLVSSDWLENISLLQWPIQHFKTKFTPDPVIKCTDVFKLIQKTFANTLEQLSIRFEKFCFNKNGENLIWTETKTLRLILPKLRKIELIVDFPASLDFLLPMKFTLEEIKVDVNYKLTQKQDLTRESSTMVQFFGYEKVMLTSNIWTLFTKVRRIEVKAIWNKEKESRLYLRENWIKK